MIGIIVTGHGNYAGGMMKAVQLLAGTPAKFAAVDFKLEDSTDELELKLRGAIEKFGPCSDGVLIFADLADEQPAKVSRDLGRKLAGTVQVEVVGGTNLGMLMECNIARGYINNISALADLAVETGLQQIARLER